MQFAMMYWSACTCVSSRPVQYSAVSLHAPLMMDGWSHRLTLGHNYRKSSFLHQVDLLRMIVSLSLKSKSCFSQYKPKELNENSTENEWQFRKIKTLSNAGSILNTFYLIRYTTSNTKYSQYQHKFTQKSEVRIHYVFLAYRWRESPA